MSITDIAFRNGNSDSSGGGAIFNAGQSDLHHVTIDHSTTLGAGGAIYNASGGSLSISASTVHHNHAGSLGGGVYNATGATLTVAASTIHHNVAVVDGGGIYTAAGASAVLLQSTLSGNSATHGGAVGAAGEVSLVSSTVTGNSASISGSGIYQTGLGSATIHNSLVWGNSATADATGNITSLGHNLIGSFSGSPIFVDSDQLNVSEANLGPLQDNGGPTWTHQLLANSPAIDAGDSEITNEFDQRLAPGVLDGPDPGKPLDEIRTVDIGAFEFGTFFVNWVDDDPESTPLGDGQVDVSSQTGDQISPRAAVQELTRLAGWIEGDEFQHVEFEGVIRFNEYLETMWLTLEGHDEDFAATGDLDIYGDITLLGNSPAWTQLDGGWGPTTPTGVDFRDRIFHVFPGSRLRIEELSVRGGHLYEGAEVESERGGAIYNNGGTVEIVDAVFGEDRLGRGGSEALLGGFIYTREGHVTVKNSVISGHIAQHQGGALFVESGDVVIDNTILTGNESKTVGGGVFVLSGQVEVTNRSEFVSNRGNGPGGVTGAREFRDGEGGGAIFIADQGIVNIDGDSRFANNLFLGGGFAGTAVYNKGQLDIANTVIEHHQEQDAIFGVIYNESELSISDSSIRDNDYGGVVNFKPGSVRIERTEFVNNYANYQGATIYNDNGDLVVADSEFRGNTNGMFAPGILNLDLDANLTVVNSTFDGQFSEAGGNAVWNEHGNVRVFNSTFVDNHAMGDAGPSAGAISHLGHHRFLGSTPESFLTLAAAVNAKQTVILVEDVAAIEELPLPLGIIVGDEFMKVTAIDGFLNALTVERQKGTFHSVTDSIVTYMAEGQRHLTLGDPGIIEQFDLPLDVIVDFEVMTIVDLKDNIATVERGRKGTSETFHLYPTDVWAISGSLEVTGSTFVGNIVGSGQTQTFGEGGAIRSVTYPFAPPTIIESSTFADNAGAVGGAIFTDIARLPYNESTGRFEFGDEPENSSAHNFISSRSDKLSSEWIVDVSRYPDDWKYVGQPTTSMVVQNSVFTDHFRPTGERWATFGERHTSEYVNLNGGDSEDGDSFGIHSPESLVSGGGNFIDADMFLYSYLEKDLELGDTQLFAPPPEKGLPSGRITDGAAPENFPYGTFVIRLSEVDNGHFINEELLVQASGPGNWDIIERGLNGTTPQVFSSRGTKVTINASGFWHPSDRFGTLDSFRAPLDTTIAQPGGIHSTATSILVADTSIFPPVPFNIHVFHDVPVLEDHALDVYYEAMTVTEVFENTITVARGVEFTKAIDHPERSWIEIDRIIYNRLEPELGPFRQSDSATGVAVPLDGPSVDQGVNQGFTGTSVLSELNLGATYGLEAKMLLSLETGLPTTLSAYIFPEDSFILVEDTSLLPTVPFMVRVNDEVMKVTAFDSISGELTVIRGLGGTDVVEHRPESSVWIGSEIDENATRLAVDEVAGFPPTPFLITVGDERMRVVHVSHDGKFLDVNRGWFSPRQSHMTGELLSHGTETSVAVTAILPMAPFVARMGDELIRIRHVDHETHVVTLERGTDRTTPQIRHSGSHIVFDNAGKGLGFSGRYAFLKTATFEEDFQVSVSSVVGALPDLFDIRIHEEDLRVTSHEPDSAGGLLLNVTRAFNGTSSLPYYPPGAAVLILTDQQHSKRFIDSDATDGARIDRGAAEAIIFNVTTTDDLPDLNPGDGLVDTVSGELSLRAAVMEANAIGGPATIVLPEGEFLLAEVEISGQITISGTSVLSTVIRGNNSRLFRVSDGASLHITNVSLNDGNASGDGGAILVEGGNLSAEKVVFSSNSAGNGGGLANRGGKILLVNSTLHDNEAANVGGAIWSLSGFTELRNVTISGNNAITGGGVVNEEGAVLRSINATLAVCPGSGANRRVVTGRKFEFSVR